MNRFYFLFVLMFFIFLSAPAYALDVEHAGETELPTLDDIDLGDDNDDGDTTSPHPGHPKSSEKGIMPYPGPWKPKVPVDSRSVFSKDKDKEKNDNCDNDINEPTETICTTD
jgi:hypothetical protein